MGISRESLFYWNRLRLIEIACGSLKSPAAH